MDSSIIGALVEVFEHVHFAKYVAVASAMLLVYDWILTFDEEVSLVWPSPWGTPKLLYMLNRYVVFADVLLQIYVLMIGTGAKACVQTFQILGGFVAFGFVIAEIILAMRTWAVWGRKPWATVVLGVLIVGSLGVDCYVLTHYLSNISYFTEVRTTIPGCLMQFGNRSVFIDFVLIIVMETVMLGMLALKAMRELRHSRSTLLILMLNDGILYFIYVFVTSVVNLVIILRAPIEQHNMLIVTQRVLHSIFCTRVLLHIRGAYAQMRAADADAIYSGVVGSSAGAALTGDLTASAGRLSRLSRTGAHGESSRNSRFAFRRQTACLRESRIGIGAGRETGSGVSMGAPVDGGWFGLGRYTFEESSRYADAESVDKEVYELSYLDTWRLEDVPEADLDTDADVENSLPSASPLMRNAGWIAGVGHRDLGSNAQISDRDGRERYLGVGEGLGMAM